MANDARDDIGLRNPQLIDLFSHGSELRVSVIGGSRG